MMQNTIAFDFDDVLFPFNSNFAKFHNERYGTDLQYEDLFSYDMHRVWECAPEVIVGRVRDFYTSDVHDALQPYPEAEQAVRELRKRHNLEIVTSRPDIVREWMRTYIRRHFPETFGGIHFTNGFAAAQHAVEQTKSDVCKAIGAVVLIEDALKHATEVAAHGIPVLMPDRPWNRNHTPSGVTRVHSWTEILDWINSNTYAEA